MRTDEQVEMYGRMCVAVDRLEGSREFAALIPEVRTNLVYAAEGAQTPDNVLAIDGRITVRSGMPHAAGKPRFGASSHMARLLIELMRVDPSYRAGINFANDPEIAEWLDEYCRRRGWTFSVIDRSREPDEIRDAERASMPWKAAEAIRAAGGNVPKVFYETGAVGKEPVTVLVGSDPIQVVEEAIEIACLYHEHREPAPKVGKIDNATFTSFLLNRLGRENESVIVPPRTGIDAGVVDIGDGKVLVIAEDPIFAVPNQPWEMFGWYTVHIGGSDVAVMGVRPQYMTYSLLMPPGTPDEVMRTIIDSIHTAANELGISIVGGHTGYYPGLAAPMIGGVTVFAIADEGSYVTSAGAEPGDEVILTKGPAIETAGLLAVVREEELLQRHPRPLIERAQALVKQMTVIQDALIAKEAGGVTAMHDATEGGVLGGLFEIANASGVGMEIDESRFIYPDEVRVVCEAFDLDPVKAIAEGSLLITARPDSSGKILQRLEAAGIKASVIGSVVADTQKRVMRRRNGTLIPLELPERDPFWPVFFAGLKDA
jgi:hydrogenase expression/formation protein HypE